MDMTGARLTDRDRHRATARSVSHALYYNLPDVLRSWRTSTDQPDDYRPDITIASIQANAVALIDAKYSEKGGRVAPERIKEVQAYLNSFGLKAAGIMYPCDEPSSAGWFDVAADGYLIREIPINIPRGTDGATATSARIRDAVADLYCPPA